MPAPSFIAPTKEPHTYTSICRCKANKFTMELPELTGGMKCNCSICSVHDIIWIFTQGEDQKPKFERQGPLIEYKWNKEIYNFQFCATCGNLVKGSMAGNDSSAINLRCFQDVNVWELKADPQWDGRAADPPYKPAKFTGPAFTGDAGEKTQTYYGNCHCGACTIAVRTKPLSEVEVNECNCAYCWKDARVHFYPSSDQVHLGGVENMKMFQTDPNGGGWFCKTCCVALFDAEKSGAKDGNGKKVPNAKETLGHDLNIRAVNIRALRDVEWAKLNINKYDGRNNDPQFVAE